MANPSWVTATNVKFNGTLDNAVVLDVTNNKSSLILWDTLSTEDQNVLTTFINNRGGVAPLVTPTSGFQVCTFKSNITGASTTGLSATSTATSGSATINLGGSAVGANASGLSSTVLSKSHLARKYSAVVTIDGNNINTISILGNTGATFTSLLTQINTALGSAAVASLTGGNIVITSATTGITSSVSIQDTGALFSSLSGYVKISTSVGISTKTYTASAYVDGTLINLSVLGSAAQTYTTLVAALNTNLGVAAVASISNGTVIITSASTGANSTVSVVDGTLFKSLTVFKSLSTPISGSSNLLTSLQTTKAVNGSPYSNMFNVVVVGTKPSVPPVMKHDIRSTYWDGTHWKYLDTDALV